MVCTYGTPLRKMSPCADNPRLGTLPRASAKVRVSVVRLSSKTLSVGPCVGLGNVVGVAELCGRKIVLNPFPTNVPWKFSNTRSRGAGVVEGFCERSLLVTPWISNPAGRLIVCPLGGCAWRGAWTAIFNIIHSKLTWFQYNCDIRRPEMRAGLQAYIIPCSHNQRT